MNFLVHLGLILVGVFVIDLAGAIISIIQANHYQDKNRH